MTTRIAHADNSPTIDPSSEPLAGPPAGSVTGRHRAAAVIAVLVAVGLVVGTIVALDALRGYQVVANIVGAGALGGATFGLLRARPGWDGRKMTVLLTWLAACGITAEAGDYQSRMNESDALGATNTTYFLPGMLWLAMGLAFVAALVVTTLTKRVRGQA